MTMGGLSEPAADGYISLYCRCITGGPQGQAPCEARGACQQSMTEEDGVKKGMGGGDGEGKIEYGGKVTVKGGQQRDCGESRGGVEAVNTNECVSRDLVLDTWPVLFYDVVNS